MNRRSHEHCIPNSDVFRFPCINMSRIDDDDGDGDDDGCPQICISMWPFAHTIFLNSDDD